MSRPARPRLVDYDCGIHRGPYPIPRRCAFCAAVQAENDDAVAHSRAQIRSRTRGHQSGKRAGNWQPDASHPHVARARVGVARARARKMGRI